VLHGFYEDKDNALQVIEDDVSRYYQDQYPELAELRSGLIASAITGLKKGFSQNHFPYMGVRWDVYPNHIGHLESTGCARCHDDMHMAENGDIISRDCNLCHTITAQGKPGMMEVGTINDSLDFMHPVDIDELWRDYLCVECHLALY
jgi:hypothetical protein